MAKRKDPERGRARVPVRLLACDDLGLVQGVQAPDYTRFEDAKVVSRWGEADRRQNAAHCLAVSACTEDDQQAGPSGFFLVAVGRTAGRISVLDGQTGQLRQTITSDVSSIALEPERNIAGLRFLTTQASGGPQLLSCTHGGSLQIHAPALDSNDEVWERLAQWTVPAEVSSMAVSEDESCIALGCEGTEVNIWDVRSQQRTFLAKSAKPNRIGLVDLPWCSAVAFMPGSESLKVLVGTGKSKLRLYDTKHGRRPVLDLTFGEARITCLAAETSGKRVWVANAAGQVEEEEAKENAREQQAAAGRDRDRSKKQSKSRK
ncbi:hypothetical protein WJX75_008542 [Coccomyxa subellipsoidea]|uniref:WD40 repeat-like protein n=1 Tax=Coccomyxa subellipsoidea TaxID=248742 RepID=A0ABR2YUR9_9CHLO